MGLLSRFFKSDEPQTVTVVNGGLFGFDDSVTDEELLQDGYASNADVYAIIKSISSAVANLPVELVRKNRAGEEEVITDGELFEFWQEPSKGLSQKEFFSQSATYLLSSGDLYYRPELITGFKPESLEIYPSGVMSIKTGKSYRDGATGYIYHDKGFDTNITTDEIIHIKYLDPTVKGLESLKGLSPIKAAYLSLEASNDIMKGAAMTVKNQGVRGILTNRTDRPMSAEDKKEASKIANQKLSGISNLNKIFTTNASLDFVQMGMSTSDLKILELGILSLRQLCSAYGVSSVLYNDPANSKFANVKEAEKALILKAAIPNLEDKILWTLNKSFMPLLTDEDVRLRVNKSQIEALQPDQALEAKKNNSVSKALLDVLVSPISTESKVNVLMFSHGLTEENAKLIIGNEQVRSET